MNCSWKYVFIRRLERGHHLSYLYNISLKVLQCRVGEGQYEEDVVVTMFAERQMLYSMVNMAMMGLYLGEDSVGDPEPGLRKILAVSMNLSPTKQREEGIHKVQLSPYL